MSRWRSILNLLYPPSCLHCGDRLTDADLCAACIKMVPIIREPLCIVCGIPFHSGAGSNHRCGNCLRRPPRFRCARACTTYATTQHETGPIAVLVQRFKYNRDVSLAASLGRFLSDHSPFNSYEYDAIVPVPLHDDRLRWRGFNQALLLARRVAGATQVSVAPFLLERTRPTQPQVELDETQRRNNVKNAFRAARPELIRNRQFLLVDDVMTTGATADECARTLRTAGARCVDVLALARVVLN